MGKRHLEPHHYILRSLGNLPSALKHVVPSPFISITCTIYSHGQLARTKKCGLTNSPDTDPGGPRGPRPPL